MKKIFIQHNGCLNLSYDFNIVKFGFKKSGYQIVDNPKDADEIIFAGCGVRSFWVKDAINQVNSHISGDHNKKVIITGCISNIETTKIKHEIKSQKIDFLDFKELIKNYTDKTFETFEKTTRQTEKTDFEGDSPLRKKISKKQYEILLYLNKIDRKYNINISKEYKKTTKGFFFYNEDEATELITVTRGCLYKCAYCTIPKGRGDYNSVPIQTIKNKVKEAVKNKIFKIILIGDEIGNYGIDLKERLSFKTLISEILSINKKIKISIRYIEPTPFYKNFEYIKELCNENRIYLMHIPLQTGSQNLLKEMKRNYNLKSIIPAYKKIINSTDTALYCNWMIGYPGETEYDFLQTVELAKELKIHLNTVIPFSARPDTEAYNRKDKISIEIINDRTERLEKTLFDIKVDYIIGKLNSVSFEEKKQIKRLLIEEFEENKLKELR